MIGWVLLGLFAGSFILACRSLAVTPSPLQRELAMAAAVAQAGSACWSLWTILEMERDRAQQHYPLALSTPSSGSLQVDAVEKSDFRGWLIRKDDARPVRLDGIRWSVEPGDRAHFHVGCNCGIEDGLLFESVSFVQPPFRLSFEVAEPARPMIGQLLLRIDSYPCCPGCRGLARNLVVEPVGWIGLLGGLLAGLGYVAQGRKLRAPSPSTGGPPGPSPPATS